jgi:diguanylate cyclase (GGDEF)-like protein
MIAPPSLVNEAHRLATLRDLHLLDTPPEERFDRLTRLARHLFNVDVAQVSLVDDNRQWFKSSAGSFATQTPREVSFCAHAIASTSTLVVPDARLDQRFHDNPFVSGKPFVRFYAGAPLSMPNGSRVGTLCLVHSLPRAFGKEELARLDDLARMAEQELHAVPLATLDELTGVPNRRAFMTLAQQTLDQCRRQHLPASMVFFDLDDFKEINDCYGHGEGDRALRAFADILQDMSRHQDIVGRIGNDEFAVLLSGCNEADAQSFIAQLQARLSGYNRAACSGYDVLFSAGNVPADTSRRCAVEALLAEADAQMYEGKRTKLKLPN